jgi:hypothetical protein
VPQQAITPSPHLQVHWEQTVDVAPILDKAVAAKKEKLEWRTSIVDLMKPLDIEPCGAQGSCQGARLHRRHQ